MKQLSFYFSLVSLGVLSACQSTPKTYNGYAGYQVEQRSNRAATLSYTLAANHRTDKEQAKLHAACQAVLGKEKTYTITILDSQEIIAAPQEVRNGIAVGPRSTSLSLSNTPKQAHGTDDYATQQALEVRPTVLKKIRYTCS